MSSVAFFLFDIEIPSSSTTYPPSRKEVIPGVVLRGTVMIRDIPTVGYIHFPVGVINN
jgi:hypothetical protein